MSSEKPEDTSDSCLFRALEAQLKSAGVTMALPPILRAWNSLGWLTTIEVPAPDSRYPGLFIWTIDTSSPFTWAVASMKHSGALAGLVWDTDETFQVHPRIGADLISLFATGNEIGRKFLGKAQAIRSDDKTAP